MDLTSNASNAAAAFDKAMNDFSSFGLLDLEDALVHNSLCSRSPCVITDIFARIDCRSLQVQVSCSVIDINNNLQAFTTNTVEFLNSGLVLPVSDYNKPIPHCSVHTCTRPCLGTHRPASA